MSSAEHQPRASLTYEVVASESGKLELLGPFQPGERLTVVVIPSSVSEFDGLLAASESTLDFWDNPLDDEDWNAAPAE